MKYDWDDSISIFDHKKKLKDGRALKVECWADNGDTFLTYKFSNKGIEGFTKKDAFDYLKSQGVGFEKDEYISELMTYSSDDNKVFYSLTIVVGESE